jgi:hypothetical protein
MILAAIFLTAAQTPADVNLLASQVDAKRLRATVEKLASWPNRNTNNDTLTEAAEWIAAQYRQIPNLEVEIMRYPVTKGGRIIADREVLQVIATLKGTDPELSANRVLVGGHFDTINMTSADPTLPSPGANDDASGTAAAMECARILSSQKFKRTIHFVAFSGEEQGLLGSAALAKRAKSEGWKLDAVLNNDIIGNSKNKNGDRANNTVRVFSEESTSHNGRELARWIEFTQRQLEPRHKVSLVFRRDRFGRGGDHSSFNREGFTAIRVVEPHEEYTQQHTDQDLPKFMDFKYLAANTRLNLRMLAQLANADQAPTAIRVDTRQSYPSTITWTGNASQDYVLYWRQTTSAVWQGSKIVRGLKATVPQHKDDHVFGVGAIGGVPISAS